jgi:hypothetical protein
MGSFDDRIRHMEIKILANKSILLKGKKESVLINPSDKIREQNTYQSRIFLFTSEKYDGMGLVSDKVLIRAPGEYEVGGIEINGYNGGEDNTIYVLYIDKIKVVILGDLKEELSDKRIEKIDSADVLLAPLVSNDDKKLSPKMILGWAKKWGVNYLIPVVDEENPQLLTKFLDQADQEGLEHFDSLKVDDNDLPDGLELKVLKVTK